MRRSTIIGLCVVAFLCFGASKCENEDAIQAANAAANAAQGSPIPWVQILGLTAGPLLTYFGLRRPAKAVYGALTYPSRPFTPEEFAEIEAGLMARGWSGPAITGTTTTFASVPKA